MVRLLEIFEDLPTREIRVKAAAFGFEKALHPDSRLRRRIRTPVLIRTASRDPRLLANGLGGNERTLFVERTWRTWRQGKLGRPHVLKSYCEQLTDNDWASRILEKDSFESPILLMLYALDTLLAEPKSKKGTKVAKRKIDRARDILIHLEQKWAVNQRFSRLFVPEKWLLPIDRECIANSKLFQERIRHETDIRAEISMQSEEIRERNKFINAIKISELENLPFGGCVSLTTKHIFPNKVELKLNQDVCGRYEIESPLKFLQYFLRMSIYIEDDSEFPIHTYAIDLLTAAIATDIYAIWFDEGISERLRSGSLAEAIDSALKIFFSHGSSDLASHLIHTSAPWGRSEQFPTEKIRHNLGSIRRAYLDALHEYGVTQLSIKKLMRQFLLDINFGIGY